MKGKGGTGTRDKYMCVWVNGKQEGIVIVALQVTYQGKQTPGGIPKLSTSL